MAAQVHLEAWAPTPDVLSSLQCMPAHRPLGACLHAEPVPLPLPTTPRPAAITGYRIDGVPVNGGANLTANGPATQVWQGVLGGCSSGLRTCARITCQPACLHSHG